MEISYTAFSAAVIRKLWTMQKRNRSSLKKAVIFFVILNSFIGMWWYMTGKSYIILLLAPTQIPKRETIKVARTGVHVVLGELAGLPAGFQEATAEWAPRCNTSGVATPPPLLLVVVTSTASNPGHNEGVRRRHAIRRGWAALQVIHSRPHAETGYGDTILKADVRVLFFTGVVNGLSLKANTSRERLHWEMKTWKDIVQVPLGEDVAPAAYQHTLALKWMEEQCPTARYLIKVDDDVHVNLRDVLHLLRDTMPRPGAKGLLLCLEKCPARHRWLTYGWLVPRIEKPCYCDGKAVLYSNDVALGIYDQVREARRFPKKEGQLTGLLRVRANVTLTPLEGRSLQGDASPEILRAAISDARVLVSESLHGVPSKEVPHSRVLFAHQPGASDDLDWLWTQAV